MPRPRSVLKSKSFVCPTGYETALQNFENRITNGDDLSIFLTDKYDESPDYNDLLLNDWDIYHFHLTNRFNTATGKALRNRWLIMAMIKENAVYLIKVVDHNDPDCFNDIELLEIVHDNWPRILEKNVIRGIPNEVLSNKDVLDLRKAHINGTIVLKDGTALQSPGGGYSLDGGSATASLYSIQLNHKLQSWEKSIVDNMIAIIESYMKSFDDVLKLNMRMVLTSITIDNLICKELNNGFYLIYSNGSLSILNISRRTQYA